MKRTTCSSGPVIGRAGRAALLALTLAACGPSALASLISYSGTVEIVSSPFPGDVAVTDQFDFAFTYDDSIVDADGSDQGFFPSALTAFSLTRDASNIGIWDPAGGTFALPTSISTSDQASDDNFFFFVDGTGFPKLGGIPFSRVAFSFNATSEFVNDTGSGQTLGQVLGGPLPVDTAFFDKFNNIIINDDRLNARGALIELRREPAGVPEPGTVALLAVGLAGLLGCRHRRPLCAVDCCK